MDIGRVGHKGFTIYEFAPFLIFWVILMSQFYRASELIMLSQLEPGENRPQFLMELGWAFPGYRVRFSPFL